MSIDSFTPFPFTSDSEYFEAVWRRTFGRFLQSAREKAGRSIEQTAAVAGMDAGQWSGIEAGAYLPMTRQQLHVAAEAVGMEWDIMARIVLLCRAAWGL